jgi:apolipoprotein D and lipocalin family protein
MKLHHILPAALTAGSLVSCQTAKLPPQQALARPIEPKKFMGPWYIIAHIPTFIEKEAYNGVESYERSADGSIATTYTFNQGSFDGPLKTYKPRGFVYNTTTNTEWRMQFIWPFKASYLITYLDDATQTTIIGVPNRNYAWIMARTKTLPDKTYSKLVGILKSSGHDVSKLRKVPQQIAR